MFDNFRKRIAAHFDSPAAQTRLGLRQFEQAYQKALKEPTPDNLDHMVNVATAIGDILHIQIKHVTEVARVKRNA